MSHPSNSWLLTAQNLAQRASTLILEYYQGTIQSQWKADASVVTEADLEADRIIREGLRLALPEHGLLSEEDGVSGNLNSPWIWLIDPLDGTKAFAHKTPGFSVMIGLLHHEEPYLGVVVDPLERLAYTAIRGQGAWLEQDGKRQRLQVSAREDFRQMPLATSLGFPRQAREMLSQKAGLPMLAPINSVGIKVGLLVRQIGDVYLSHHPVNYWDSCAPQIILEEAGGKMTDERGDKLSYRMDGNYAHPHLLLASNGHRHRELVDLMEGLDFKA